MKYMSPSRPRPPEVVVDTDIVISGAGAFARPISPTEPIETTLLRRWLIGEWTWITSDPLLSEYQELLLRRGAPEPRVRRIISEIRARSRMVVPRTVKVSLPDPGDAHVIGTSLAGGGPILTRNVTDYPATLVTTVSPEQMSEVIDRYTSDPMYRRRR